MLLLIYAGVAIRPLRRGRAPETFKGNAHGSDNRSWFGRGWRHRALGRPDVGKRHSACGSQGILEARPHHRPPRRLPNDGGPILPHDRVPHRHDHGHHGRDCLADSHSIGAAQLPGEETLILQALA